MKARGEDTKKGEVCVRRPPAGLPDRADTGSEELPGVIRGFPGHQAEQEHVDIHRVRKEVPAGVWF